MSNVKHYLFSLKNEQYRKPDDTLQLKLTLHSAERRLILIDCLMIMLNLKGFFINFDNKTSFSQTCFFCLLLVQCHFHCSHFYLLFFWPTSMSLLEAFFLSYPLLWKIFLLETKCIAEEFKTSSECLMKRQQNISK